MPKPVLTYFDLPGRGEAIRLAYTVNGVDFEDKRVTAEQWGKEIKKTMPNQTLPHIADGDVQINNSIAALIYAGQLGKLVPKDPAQNASIIELLCSMEDVNARIAAYIVSADDATKKANLQALNDKVSTALPALELFVNYHGKGGHCCGDALTVGDLQIHAAVTTLRSILNGADVTKKVEASDTIMKVYNKVSEHPKIKAYYKK
eukprot:Selendium_serpulae@DN2863_c0_g1_i2.p1